MMECAELVDDDVLTVVSYALDGSTKSSQKMAGTELYKILTVL